MARLNLVSRRNLATTSVAAASAVGTPCAINVLIACAEKSATYQDLAPNSTPPLNFDQFMAPLRDTERVAPIISARRFEAALHIDMQTLARLAHVHRNTVSQLGWLRKRAKVPPRRAPGHPSCNRYIRRRTEHSVLVSQ